MSDALSRIARDVAVARYYDLDTTDIAYDAELYQQLAQRADGPILELAVGSGRLAIPLALAGHRVVGIDNDPAMLDRARAAWAAARGSIDPTRFSVVEGDFTTYRSDARFGLAFIAVNTFLLMPDDDSRRAVLAMMRDHLHAGGIAAVEVSTPDEVELGRYDGRLQLEWLREDPETGEQVTKAISARWDPETATVLLTQLYESTPPHGGPLVRVTNTDELHLVSADRLGTLAQEAGFDAVDVRGDHLAIPHGAGSHRAILVASLV